MTGPARREYVSGPIAVSFDARICLHVAECLRGLPEVFNLEARPWIQPGNAMTDEVIEVVNRCPSGALQWRWTEREEWGAAPAEGAEVRVQPNGPLYVRGNFRLEGGDGEPLTESQRVALCRCGMSGNKPFCDNTHRTEGWRDQA